MGLPVAEIYKLEYYKGPLVEVEAVEMNVNLLVPKVCVQKLAAQAQAEAREQLLGVSPLHAP